MILFLTFWTMANDLVSAREAKFRFPRIAAGGYPAALARRAAARRRAWYRDYVETQVQRDVRDLTRIHSLDALPKLLAAAAAQTAQLVNVAALAAPFELTRQTIHE